MKYYLLLIVSIFVASACGRKAHEKSTVQSWAGQSVDLTHIVNERDSFIMLDMEGRKVGGMIWEKEISGNSYVHNDVSYFDDGSIYEEASFYYNLVPLAIDSVQIVMKMSTAQLVVNYKIEGKRVLGTFKVVRDTSEQLIKIDSVYTYDILRPEIYSLLHSISFDSVNTFPLRVFSPEGLAIADAEISILGKETVDEGYGTFECTKIALDGGGVIPDNTIWVSEDPRRIVKVIVPGAKLNIVLAKHTP